MDMPPPSPRACQRRPQRYHCRIRRIHVMSRLFSEADALRAQSPEMLIREQAVAKVLDAKPEYGIIYDRATQADLRK